MLNLLIYLLIIMADLKAVGIINANHSISFLSVVEFETSEDANNAIEQMHDSMLDERPIFVRPVKRKNAFCL
jgi:hypothetical protein